MADIPATSVVKTVPKPRDQHLRDMADCIRLLSMDAVHHAKSGHPGAPMGMADVAIVLFRDFMQFNGHDPSLIETVRFRQIDSKTAGIRSTITPTASRRQRAHLVKASGTRSVSRSPSAS